MLSPCLSAGAQHFRSGMLAAASSPRYHMKSLLFMGSEPEELKRALAGTAIVPVCGCVNIRAFRSAFDYHS